MNAPDGGPAFPKAVHAGFRGQDGMTLRDWFAGQAITASSTGVIELAKSRVYDDDTPLLPIVAQVAYELADLMLAERAKGTK